MLEKKIKELRYLIDGWPGDQRNGEERTSKDAQEDFKVRFFVEGERKVSLEPVLP